jgi:hypothetical protein
MTVFRVLATIILLIVGLLFRRRPLILLLVGLGIHRLWRNQGISPTNYRPTIASHRR